MYFGVLCPISWSGGGGDGDGRDELLNEGGRDVIGGDCDGCGGRDGGDYAGGWKPVEVEGDGVSVDGDGDGIGDGGCDGIGDVGCDGDGGKRVGV